MPADAIYTDLSGYFDLMCADIDYQAQSRCIHRLQHLLGNSGKRLQACIASVHAAAGA